MKVSYKEKERPSPNGSCVWFHGGPLVFSALLVMYDFLVDQFHFKQTHTRGWLGCGSLGGEEGGGGGAVQALIFHLWKIVFLKESYKEEHVWQLRLHLSTLFAVFILSHPFVQRLKSNPYNIHHRWHMFNNNLFVCMYCSYLYCYEYDTYNCALPRQSSPDVAVSVWVTLCHILIWEISSGIWSDPFSGCRKRRWCQ